MKIGIDARFVGPEGTGLGKYTEKLILNLAKIDSTNDYVIFLKRDNWNYLNLEKNKNFKKVEANIKWYTLEEQIKLPSIFQKQNLDLLHVPHFNIPLFYKGKLVVTIHDLIHHHFSEKAATTKNPIIFKFKRGGYKLLINFAVKKSCHILVPSNFVKNELISTFKIKADKITVTYEAAEDEYFHSQSGKVSNLLDKYSIKVPFLIYVGNAYPHKNLKNLLYAFRSLSAKHKGLALVLVCSRSVFTQKLQKKIKELNLENKVILTGYIEANELSQVIKSSRAYVFPSLEEGFGIPPLNALASGVPVVCSSIPVLKEVLGSAAYYFDPKSPKDIETKIDDISTNQKLTQMLIENGNLQVKKYSWQKMAQETLNIYEKFAKSEL